MSEHTPDNFTATLRGSTGYEIDADDMDTLRTKVLSRYLARQRWFSRDHQPTACELAYAAPVPGVPDTFLAEFEVSSGTYKARYFLPLAVLWDQTVSPMSEQYAIVRVQRGSAKGTVTDAYTRPAFVHAVLASMREHAEIDVSTPRGTSRLTFKGEPGLDAMLIPAESGVKWFLGEQSNSSMTVGGVVMLKLVRRLADGIHPEAEMTRRLTTVGYRNCAALLGELVRRDASGAQATLALLHANVPNEGDAWSWTERYLGNAKATHDLTGYATVAASIGRRLAELHAAMALPTDDAAFSPEPATSQDAHAWARDIIAMLDRARVALKNASLSGPAAAARESVLAAGDALDRAIESQAAQLEGTLRTRVHGDFHLGQVLISGTDAYLIDFEGEPVRSLDERRRKATPLRDVSGLLRSFAYAQAAFLDKPARGDDKHTIADAPSTGADGWSADFQQTAASAFLHAYRDVAAQAPHPWITLARLDTLLPLALLEKAAYEVVYEASHRPDWLNIPLTGLADLVADILAAEPLSKSTP